MSVRHRTPKCCSRISPAAKQAALADRLVLTKTDLVSDAVREEVLARLRALSIITGEILVHEGAEF